MLYYVVLVVRCSGTDECIYIYMFENPITGKLSGHCLVWNEVACIFWKWVNWDERMQKKKKKAVKFERVYTVKHRSIPNFSLWLYSNRFYFILFFSFWQDAFLYGVNSWWNIDGHCPVPGKMLYIFLTELKYAAVPNFLQNKLMHIIWV